MRPLHDDFETREERLADVMEEIRAAGSQRGEQFHDAAALGRTAREYAAFGRTQSKEAIARATAASRKARAQ